MGRPPSALSLRAMDRPARIEATSRGAPRRIPSWEETRRDLAFDDGRHLNIAHAALDRHVAAGHGARIALRWLGRSGARREISYAQLDRDAARFADALRRLGAGRGARVFSLLGRDPALFVAALGTLKAGAVFCPLFQAFGPEPVRTRLGLGKGEILVTTEPLYRKRVAPIRDLLPELRHVLLAGHTSGEAPPGTLLLDDLLARADPDFMTVPTDPEETALLHFTSGTTGRPKGALHVHAAVIAHDLTARWALDLRADDIFWCTADPGWVTGMSYGVIAPLVVGATLVVDEAEFDVARWYETLARERVNVWYTAPTAIRMLMRAGEAAVPRARLDALRFMASVGEPLNPEAVLWSARAFGQPFHDNWWQTETGGIMIANDASMDVKPGSMGRPVPGVEAAIVARDADGRVRELAQPMTRGELALRPGWPSMFRGYLGEPERYAKCFAGGWYLTGDLAMRDADGCYWFVGRSDDVIKAAGHLVGPFEVESALMEHPAVAEAAVIGKPDAVAGESIKAFVVPRAGHVADEALRSEILAHARRRLGPAIAPREIAFATDLPKTRSGKIMRRLLRARELGLPEGDLSMLEGGAP
jgi:acetyl-CoA synthetase